MRFFRASCYNLSHVFLCLFCLLSVCAQAAPLASSKQMPELGVTDVEQLGRNQKGYGLEVGERVNLVELNNHLGQKVSLQGLMKQTPLLVIFYRGGWCPYCNIQIRQLTEAWLDFEVRGITPVFISVDETAGSALTQKTYEIPFPVLSDPDLKAHTAFRVSVKVSRKTRKKLMSKNINIESWSGRRHHKIAMPAAFIVSQNGYILWAHSSVDYTTRPSVKQLLAAIDSVFPPKEEQKSFP